MLMSTMKFSLGATALYRKPVTGNVECQLELMGKRSEQW